MGIMDKFSVSIIVPVYNTDYYLAACIQSVLAQTIESWELLLIDDGSTDGSGAICDEYASKDYRIKVIHKNNEGVSMARNAGLAAASGEYIGFVDSDDTIKPEMYERMYHAAKANNAEIVMCDAVTVFSDSCEEPDTIKHLPGSCILNRSDFTPQLLKELAGSSWRCIYSRALIQRHSSQFPVALKFSEDRVFNIYNMGYANRLVYIKEPFYNRLLWDGSAVNRFHADYFEAVKKAAAAIEEAIKVAWNDNYNYQDAYKEQFIGGAISAICNYYYKTSTLSRKERREAVKNLCDDLELRQAIEYSSEKSDRGGWILKRRVLLLRLYARAANMKHGR